MIQQSNLTESIMPGLAVLEEARVFPPKKTLLVIWGGTLLLSVFGIVVTPIAPGITIGPLSFWIAVFLIALWQLTGVHWVQVDNEGIRYKNVFQRGRELPWDQVTEFREEEFSLAPSRIRNRQPYVILHLSNHGKEGVARAIKMRVTNDQIEFETLRTIVRAAVPGATGG